MMAQPYWLSAENTQPVTKLTLYLLNANNESFAEMLADAIDEMIEWKTNSTRNA